MFRTSRVPGGRIWTKNAPMNKRCLVDLAFLCFGLLVALPDTSFADAVPRPGNSATAAGLQGTVAQFVNDLGGTTNVVTWDEAALSPAPGAPPSSFLNARGLALSTDGSGVQISSGNASLAPLRFGGIDPGYAAALRF